MANFLSLQCPNCQARYAVPDVYQPHIEAKMMLCAECRRSWIPIPGSRDGVSIEASKVDLRKFRQKPGQDAGQEPIPKPPTSWPAAEPSPAAPPSSTPNPAPSAQGAAQAPTAQTAPTATPPSGSPAPPSSQASSPPSQVWRKAQSGGTVTIPTATAMGLTLRMTVQGPGANLTGVFDLQDRCFVIGRTAAHLRLPKAAIPDHAIEIRAVAGGFMVEGVNGFPLILGTLSAPSAMVIPGESVSLAIVPYQIELQTSNTPGSPVKELASSPQPPAPQAPPQPVGPAPGAPPVMAPPPGTPAGSSEIQELAADIDQKPGAFGGGATNLLDEVDGDMTIADMGAIGLNAQSHHVDPLKGLEIALIRAEGPEQGQKFAVSKTPLIIGRSDHGLQIRDKRVSSKHAQLDVSGPWVYTLKDLASTNGTMINGRPISVAQLGDGDLVSFGGVTFTFKAQKA